ncbi:hypothetical protein BB560_006852 [Smittium megazygosporum]|uniref:Cleft lip and palate transmembrane protein 1 n=1 Tax=Smittium megazygosporum TaxID=133381 RepID=A0A2T9Y0W6_9FUNG|nr:hypothetical protein BB560_006852 [Smittium megazygosporum]
MAENQNSPKEKEPPKEDLPSGPSSDAPASQDPGATQPSLDERVRESMNRDPFTVKDFIFQGILFFVASQAIAYFLYRNSSKVEEGSAPSDVNKEDPSFKKNDEIPNQQPQKQSIYDGLPFTQVVPYWKKGTPLDFSFYISTEKDISDRIITRTPSIEPIWEVHDIKLGSEFSYNKQIEFKVTDRNAVLDPESSEFDVDNLALKNYQITTSFVHKKDNGKRNLIGKNNPIPKDDPDKDLIEGVSYTYLYPNVTLSLVDSSKILFNFKKENPEILKWVDSIPSERVIDYYGNGGYSPILYLNNFWQLRGSMFRVNNTKPNIKLNLEFNTLTMLKFQLYVSAQAGIEQNMALQGSDSVVNSGVDMLKRALIENSPYVLALTLIVSILHSIFDMLAFKNDVQFWRKKKNSEGLSFRALILGLFFETVIFLYLLESSEDTSKVIIVKVASPLKGRTELLQIAGMSITIRDFSTYSQKETDTEKYDKIAFKYLSWVAYPLLFGYTVYSLVYKEFKSWYSFILSVLVGYVYTFGFIAMTPQLYINYKLKSVAHMPWRTFIYKSLNTFIDDLFAFVMPMPMLHRIATLRDDVIFFIYLYQRYLYPVDHKRANEFGQVGEDEPSDSKQKTD